MLRSVGSAKSGKRRVVIIDNLGSLKGKSAYNAIRAPWVRICSS